MFDTIAGDGDPRMFSLLPYRVMRRGKVSVSESAGRNGKKVVMRTGVIPKRRSAGRAEMKAGFVATVANMLIHFVLAANRHRIRCKPRLRSKGRSAALLAVIAMTHRDADGFASASGRELAAAAGGGASASHVFALPT